LKNKKRKERLLPLAKPLENLVWKPTNFTGTEMSVKKGDRGKKLQYRWRGNSQGLAGQILMGQKNRAKIRKKKQGKKNRKNKTLACYAWNSKYVKKI